MRWVKTLPSPELLFTEHGRFAGRDRLARGGAWALFDPSFFDKAFVSVEIQNVDAPLPCLVIAEEQAGAIVLNHPYADRR